MVYVPNADTVFDVEGKTSGSDNASLRPVRRGLRPWHVRAKVAGKPKNKASIRTAAEPAEPRAGAEGNVSQQSTYRTQCRDRVSQALERVRQAARARKKERFTALLHHISIDLLRLSFYALKRSAAPGVDGVTWKDYEAALESDLRGLYDRVHRGAYRALPSRRKYIPKPDGRQRPLGIAALEDKILQRSTRRISSGSHMGSDQSAVNTMP